MKGGLCFIYTSLLTISVLSSCALFILVVSEALQVDLKSNSTADGLQNVTNKISELLPENHSKNQFPPVDDLEGRINAEEPKTSIPQDAKMTFPDALSLNSVTTDGLPDTGQPPIHVSLADTAKLDLKKVDELLYVNDSDQHNDTKTFTIVETDNDVQADNALETASEPTLVIKAKPMHEARLAEETTVTPPAVDLADNNESQPIDPLNQNDSTTEQVPTKPDIPHEDIPSFSEWAQKQLAEAEKKDTGLNQSSQPSTNSASVGNKNAKLRSKNYASPACGAKVVAANQEATAAAAVLSHNKDEYMLNTCRSRVWFVVELCEAVQAQRVELANFELFSSTPKDFSVHFSDRYPTREWAGVGRFSAADLRDVQSFDLYPHMFGKFIKVEIHSHHGSEHYCPVSLFRVYGTSEFEALEKENAQHAAPDDDDDEDAGDAVDAPGERNLFGSARDAVMSIMKKAAQALVHTEPSNTTVPARPVPAPPLCCSPSHLLVCDNCSHEVYHGVHRLLSCAAENLAAMLRRDFVRDTLRCTTLCQPFGLDFKSTKRVSFRAERATYLKAIFSETYLAALCNMLAIHEKKVVLNTSFESEQNITANNTVDKSLNDSDVNNIEITQLPINNDTTEEVKKEADPPANENKTLTQDKSNDSENKTDDKEKPNENKEKTDPKIVPTPVVNDNLAQEQVGTNVINKTDKESADEEKGKNDQEEKEGAKPDTKPAKLEPSERTHKEAVTIGEEINDQILIDNDSFMSEFDQLSVDPTPAGPSTTNNQNQAQTIQKESVFLRLSNRVKTLERNMSLSGQYLEELSRRYKKQVEEMQRSFEKTMLQMTEERRKSNEREQKYLEQMTNLQEQLAQMATAITMLMNDRDSWFGNITLFKFFILQFLIITAILYYISKRKQPNPVIVPVVKKSTKRKEKLRRKSVEGVSGHETPSAKKRRPSEEALQIARLSAEELQDELQDDDYDGDWQVARKHRKRKTSIIHRNIETNKLSWIRRDSIGVLQETPITLDEEEFIAPVSEPTEFNTKDIAPKKPPKPNGSIFSNIKNKAKTRRLSSPAFLRTLSRQSSRSTPSPVVRTLEPIFNGKLGRKAASESPTGSLWSDSTDMSQVNGQCDSDVASVKQKKKTFKNLFKKVF